MIKVMRLSDVLEMGAFVGIDAESDGLTRAERIGVPITAGGIDGLVALPGFADIQIVFDATSAGAHTHHNEILQAHGKRVIDLTPAAKHVIAFALILIVVVLIGALVSNLLSGAVRAIGLGFVVTNRAISRPTMSLINNRSHRGLSLSVPVWTRKVVNYA